MQLQLEDHEGAEQTDPEVLKTLERLAEEWIVTVAGALAKEAKKTPLGNVCGFDEHVYYYNSTRGHFQRLSFGGIGTHRSLRSLNN